MADYNAQNPERWESYEGDEFARTPSMMGECTGRMLYEAAGLLNQAAMRTILEVFAVHQEGRHSYFDLEDADPELIGRCQGLITLGILTQQSGSLARYYRYFFTVMGDKLARNLARENAKGYEFNPLRDTVQGRRMLAHHGFLDDE